jgi:hypothetical protein
MKLLSQRLLKKAKSFLLLSKNPFLKVLNYQKAWFRFWSTFALYKKSLVLDKTRGQKNRDKIVLYPCIWDAVSETPIDPTYYYQDSWAFDLIVRANPGTHVDIGSHHKYVALLSKVVPVTMVDLRPLSLPMDSIKFLEGSILDLPFSDGTVESLSSLCVIEHIGLGRYGDPLDPDGSIKACKELSRVIKLDGSLYISVPVEPIPKTYFNAHRSFLEAEFLSLFAGFQLLDKAYIYGKDFTRKSRKIFGIGCYHLIKAIEAA